VSGDKIADVPQAGENVGAIYQREGGYNEEHESFGDLVNMVTPMRLCP